MTEKHEGEDEFLIGEIFKKQGKVSDAQLQQAAEAAKEGKGHLGDELIKMGLLSGDEVHEALAVQFGMEVVGDLFDYNLPDEISSLISYHFVRKHLVLPLTLENDTVLVAVNDPLNLDPLDELRLTLNYPVKAVYAPKMAIAEAISVRFEQEKGAASKLLADLSEQDKVGGMEEVEIYDLLDQRDDLAPIVKLLNLILLEAVQQGASDIHFEPFENDLKVRYRIDGVLQNRHSPAHEYQGQLLTRIKVMSKMDIAERRLPQDGRIKLMMGGRDIDFRVSTVPVSHGERIVLRILLKGDIDLGLNKIGMPDKLLNLYRNLVKLPEGILLVTGPTGSGKTTTLYSTISEILSDETNIMTIEDPVEYKLAGIAQIGVQPKINLDFSRGLRHILRQDPDVIMIGEIRDLETAEIAVQASLTGHLVLSTLHTNDAPSAITRLVDMGIEPYLLSSSMAGVLAQRLVRRICPDCKEKYEPTERELADIGLTHKDLKGKGKHVWRGAKCSSCFETGYKGRHGLYELMPITEGIRHQIAQSPDAVRMREVALKDGMITLRDHGAQLVKEGITTIAEVLRVSRAVGQ